MKWMGRLRRLRVNSQRIWNRIEDLGQIGLAPEGGVTRLAFSKEDRRATDKMIEWMKEVGLEVRTDAIGNLFARRKGRTDGPPVLVGSHLDSVPNGGKFDGAAGVIAALEVVQVLEEERVETELPIEVVSFVNEEGSRYAGGLMGSMAVAGLLAENITQIKDKQGITLGEALKAYGAQPEKLAEAKRNQGDFTAYFELHIEQATLLEQNNLACGIVTGIAGPHQLTVRIKGRSGHAGATPMNMRKDPMVVAGMIIQEVERSAMETGETTRGTVGYIRAYPGAVNVIPEQVEFSLDYRDIDLEQRERAVERIKRYIHQLCHQRGLTYEIETDLDTPPTLMDEHLIRILEASAGEQRIPVMKLPSGAAHDAMIMQRLCPSAMIFVRSQDGLSHCPEEFTSQEDLEQGAQLLLHAVLKTANKELT